MQPAPDVPDSDENARVFGRPSSRPGAQAAFLRISISLGLAQGKRTQIYTKQLSGILE